MAETDVKPELDTESTSGVTDKGGTSHRTQGANSDSGEPVEPETECQTGS